jgi:hypothetical protein
LERNKSSVSLNLSNQANSFNARRSSLSQFNYFVILGLDFLDAEEESQDFMPVKVRIHKSGELSMRGIDGEIFNDENTCIFSDRKVTTSDT